MPGPQQEKGIGTLTAQTPRLHKMSETWLVPVIMGVQAVALALVARLRWRCFPDENGKCTCISGCTEHALQESGGIDAQEFCIADQKVLLVSGRIN